MQLQTKQDISISFTTTSNKKSADELAEKLVAEGLAACVSMIEGVNSVYSWKGQVENSSEILLIIKSKSSLTEKLAKRISELHSYETPEFISITAEKASEKYAEWINTVTKE